MTLYSALELLDTPFDCRYAVLLYKWGYPFSEYVVIASDIKNLFYPVCLGRQFVPDLRGLLEYVDGHTLAEMPRDQRMSSRWLILNDSEFNKYNQSLWRRL